jgi:hypothetical protein
LFIKNLSLQAKQSIPHTTVMFCGHCMKMCEDFTLKFGNKRTGCCIKTTGNFLPKTWLLSPTHPTHLTWPPATFLFPWLKIKLKGRHFDTTEAIKARLNTLTEHNFQDAF